MSTLLKEVLYFIETKDQYSEEECANIKKSLSQKCQELINSAKQPLLDLINKING